MCGRFTLGTSASALDMLNTPQGLALDRYNNLYIADFGNRCVMNSDNLAVLIDMGFSLAHAKEALHHVDNLEDAIAFLLNDTQHPSPPSSPGVSQADSSEDETSYSLDPRRMLFILNIEHTHLTFDNILLNIAQSSFDLYEQLSTNRQHVLGFKSWHKHGQYKQVYTCQTSQLLEEIYFHIEHGSHELNNQICTSGLIYDNQNKQQPLCLDSRSISKITHNQSEIMFGFGGSNTPTTTAQTQPQASSLFQEQLLPLREYCREYNRISEQCFNDCINDFTGRAVSAGEESCIRTCLDKFIKVNQRIAQRFQEQQILMNENQSTVGKKTGLFK
ncbi:unnamed protein product [Didymodactylos carnosus]|uniref:UBA domain-containing protein n=1 Tax=Didymodactylos carnosus TaxID=1234261 RepID=A0A813V3J4_9BILA|nr:unnamed protein product [Didymodactylos carnosus]CAF0836758.1 unnamed protein product [Didymodactylos carnosus]CAF3550065.1 unnamed protein product [Didymodactylos carnosus]CAF3623980.1 unnamed protein product [Didymodactylos carnosus]